MRRDKLVAAGVELLGGAAGPALTVRAVCRESGLTERYFYESFADRDEFVRAVYDHVCSTAMSALTSSTISVTKRSTASRGVVDDVSADIAVLHTWSYTAPTNSSRSAKLS